MKIIILLLALTLSACSSKEYSLSYISKDDDNSYFDDKGQQWLREETDGEANIKGGKLIKKNTNSFCFTDKGKIDALISRSSSVNNDQDIRWYAKFSSTKSEEYILFGENKGYNFVKINSTTYVNNFYPSGDIYSIHHTCQETEREKRRKATKEELKHNKIYDGINLR